MSINVMEVQTDADISPMPHIAKEQSTAWTSSDFRLFEVQVGNSTFEMETSERRLPDFVLNAVKDLNRISALKADWDTYGALPVNQTLVDVAFKTLVELLSGQSLPSPQIGATVRGGVEFEWHIDGKDLELLIEQPFTIHAYFHDEVTGEEWEEDFLRNRLPDLRRYVERFAQS